MHQKKIAEIVQKLKKVREEEGISFQRIVDLVEQNGESVSLSTVKRVFEEGSETYGYQYESTLKPIADAVLGIYGSSEDITPDEADAMKAIIDYKSDKIADLTRQLESKEESHRRGIEYLKEQVSILQTRLERKDDLIEKLIDAILKMNSVGEQ